MCQHPALIETLARARTDEIRRAASSTRTARGPVRRGLRAATRGGAGWLLVELGLRLAVPRGSIDRGRTLTID